MRIILTHEQADFDAIASMLGAHLLDDSALPVLPRRLNRNVSAFLTLYGEELPFVDPRDLPNTAIDLVTLVDTQSAVSVRGMTNATRYIVIDHHPPRSTPPPNWTMKVDDLGAATTLVVEALRERDTALSTVQSTLLLLGIYEDTGSLTYSRTTPRDLRAAAFLLEQGAELTIAADFLNHPLSLPQQALYDYLRSHNEHFHIHGHTIMIATGDAGGVEEELSTIVHKLRDLLDPDALFVLLTTHGGVQMIARSTTDNIDVAEIVAHFGGGGHERAAAGLVRGQDIEMVRDDLVRILPDHVRRSVTVAQIMSRGLQVLATDTPAEMAALRMRRYGYEGYPVVERLPGITLQANGDSRPLHARVVGLLTRRAVDRALAHRLNLPAASLMEAGEVTITPDASVEELQRLMTETGWGQVPVVDPASGEIIGIVTRTDILKTLATQTRRPGEQNLASRLESALPPAHLSLLKLVAEEAHEQRLALYIVGGFVRDLYLERPSLDFDLVVEGDAIQLARALARRYGGRVTSHSRFGTAKWHLHRPAADMHGSGSDALPLDQLPSSLDLVSARTEFYTHPTALPTVERGSIKLDLHRRDFTINTLALRLDGRHYGEMHDYWGGLNDLRQGLVRVLHSLSFVDDPTRILRAARFEQRFDFQIEERTLVLLGNAIPLLDRLSGDRVRHELNHILKEPRVCRILGRLDELALLKAIHPSLTWNQRLCQWIESRPAEPPETFWGLSSSDWPALRTELGYILWMLDLPDEQVQSLAFRLKLSTHLIEAIQAACHLWRQQNRLVGARTSEVVSILEDMPPLSRYACYLAEENSETRQVLYSYVTKWQNVSPMIDGLSLRQKGLPPGPAYRRILSRLRSAWLDGDINSSEQEAALLNQLILDEAI
jgi:tRNA nucleotidyltransferase (CCA-adding enzyme)